MNHFPWIARRGSAPKRMPAFMWPSPHYTGSRVMPMRWLDLHYIRQDPYSSGPIKPYLSTHLEYLQRLAEQVIGDPLGERTLMDWHLFASSYVNPNDTLQAQPEDAIQRPDGSLTGLKSVWLENGIAFTNDKLMYLFGKLKELGLELDYYTTQHEWSLTPWAMSSEQMDAMSLDPRWPAVADELGFPDLQGVKYFWQSQTNRDQLSKFNAWCAYQTHDALERSLYSTLRHYWPQIKITDYSHLAILPQFEAYDANGWPMNTAYRGNPWPGACSDIGYLTFNQFEWTAPPHIQPFPRTHWNGFVKSLNDLKAIKLSAGSTPVHPEFAGFKQLETWGVATRDVYREHIFHAALHGVDALQFWEVKEGDGEIIDEVLAELDEKIHGHRVSEDPMPIEWHPQTVQTTLKVGTKNVTRITRPDFTGEWVIE